MRTKISRNAEDRKDFVHSIRWSTIELERIEEAAKRLEALSHAEVNRNAFIRGAVLRRVSEVLEGRAA